MVTSSQVSNLIWSSADDVLRNVFKPSEYGEVILPFIVMRRLDCVQEPQKDKTIELYNEYKDRLSDPSPVILNQINLPFFNNSYYDLSRLKSDPNNISRNFNNYIAGFSGNVRDIFINFKIAPIVQKLEQNNRLYMMVDKFSEIDLSPEAIDNHRMGTIYEEILRRFYEEANEDAGDHYTPRDVVTLLARLLFEGNKQQLQGEGKIRSVYDPCAGTGGMLTVGKKWVLENINPNLKLDLYGQTLLDESYAVCKSDFLLSGENPGNIHGPLSSISNDAFEGQKFDYMITNPPYGVSWNIEKEFVTAEAKDPNGRFSVGTPRSSDGQLLFLQHLIHKMSPEGSRIGIVFNGSPLFAGDAGSGESEIRKWIIENDWLECIVQMPDRMFFNTGITTYLWILTNNKQPDRKGKTQLIDGSSFFTGMRKNLGAKSRYISDDQMQDLLTIYESNQENEYSKIYPNNFFGYTKVVIEQPLIENGVVQTDRKGNPKPDASKRDTERVPLSENIDEYYDREVRPHLPDSWMDRSKDKIGYEINFTKYFYKFIPCRSLEDISQDLKSLDDEIKRLSMEIADE